MYELLVPLRNGSAVTVDLPRTSRATPLSPLALQYTLYIWGRQKLTPFKVYRNLRVVSHSTHAYIRLQEDGTRYELPNFPTTYLHTYADPSDLHQPHDLRYSLQHNCKVFPRQPLDCLRTSWARTQIGQIHRCYLRCSLGKKQISSVLRTRQSGNVFGVL